MLDRTGATLLEELKTLERELHQLETRRNRNRMEALLDPEFVEFGRSGRRYSRADVLNEFAPDRSFPAIHSGDFRLVMLSQQVALLTYVSAHLDANGTKDLHALRSSIWVRDETGWQIRFHQGTSTQPTMLPD